VASEPVRVPGPIRFGDDFELDLRAYELRRSGRRLRLERIPMELLLLLVEQRGEIVTRDQIVERVWGKDVFLDTDNSINAAIRKIRQILKDDPEEPRFVQTVTGRGYRFIAPVIAAPTSTPPLQVVTRQAVPAEDFDRTEASAGRVSPARASRIRPARLVGILLVLVVIGIAIGAYWQSSRARVRRASPSGRLMLAVLPFENLTGDATQDYFSDGMTEEMITQLGNLDPSHLGVIARTSVMHYQHSHQPLDQIGRELGVQYVLEGSVRRDSDKVRITAQLIQMKDQSHLWARQYDRELSSLLALQGEIAHETADEIRIALGDHKPTTPPGPVSLSPRTYEAYDLYLKGQYFWNKRTVDGFQRAIEYFQQALAKDPNYARAYAGIADSYALIGGYSGAPQTEFEPKARAAALRAVEIDDSLPEAHTALALIVQNYDWDWQTAEKEFRRAIELNPNYATAHHWYAEHLMWLGRFDEAFQESERARQLDPLSLIIATDNAAILYYSRQYDRAIERFRAVREMDPSFSHAGMIRGAYAQEGMFADVLAEIKKERRLLGDGPWSWSEQAYILGRTGQRVRARRALAKLEQWNQRQPVDPALFAYAHIGMGNKDEAFVWLEKAYAQHSNAMSSLKVNPIYDPLRGDPRFQDLLRRVGLAN
jgi:TolB-like protein/DNA-binding winged helix-turn-helix (wHTH) protein/Tfp pilus assembly protein PilF